MLRNTVTDIFFDLDHTLWDFEKNSALTFEKILLDHNIDISLDDFLKVYVPANHAFWKLYREERITKEELRYQRLKTVFDRLRYRVSDTLIHKMAEDYIANLSSYNHLFPNAVAVLDYLKPKYNLHVITNGFREVQGRKLRNAGIHQYFGQVIDSEMAGVKKPNPIIFELALEKAGTRPERSLMIGDSLEADIQGALAVGYHAVHFNAHGEPAHGHCKMIDDLIEIKFFL
ncbi:YjjG family noncanonical pyrimidine nucleotidase [Pseudozobellia thermophila]|uniref:Putative hydrolase of the HAD superfamily n=1 Tax=Pseudozobellia thermophila TaxID=192903 RepID=A0A1M6LUJ8_9FLAO|nr:YjjG family noncanonical pyrimidine nucleotidase [Pseudozobellia thermophila]SHJ74918.1 putative hydrolase of the HAD superfamily [Pseudozobellia thermophila]